MGSSGVVLGYALAVVGFIRGSSVHSGAPLWSLGSSGVVGFNRVRLGDHWVHSVAPWGSLGSSRVVGFTRVRPEGRWVHLRSLGSHGVRLWGAWVHPESLCSLG